MSLGTAVAFGATVFVDLDFDFLSKKVVATTAIAAAVAFDFLVIKVLLLSAGVSACNAFFLHKKIILLAEHAAMFLKVLNQILTCIRYTFVKLQQLMLCSSH